MISITTALSNFIHRRSADPAATEEVEANDGEVVLRSWPSYSFNSYIEDRLNNFSFNSSPRNTRENRSISAGNDSHEDSQRNPMPESSLFSLPDEDANIDDDDDDVESENSEDTSLLPTAESPRQTTERSVSASNRALRELQEERKIVRHRTGICVVPSSFVLFRFWLEAVSTGQSILIFFSCIFTIWIIIFILITREREEEIDRTVDELLYRISTENRPQGVCDEAKGHWDRFDYKSIECLKKRGGYCAEDIIFEEPLCSICLCEYEEGDKLVSLPCRHIFCEDCITTWTANHTRCPLCNCDLESILGKV